MSRLQYFLDNWLRDGGEVVGLQHRPHFTRERLFWYSFLSEAESTGQGHSVAGRIRSLKKFNELIGTLTRNLPACMTEPKPTMLRVHQPPISLISGTGAAVCIALVVVRRNGR
jgi:hypothetical protein